MFQELVRDLRVFHGVLSVSEVFQGVSVGIQGRSRRFPGSHRISGSFQDVLRALPRSITMSFRVVSGEVSEGFRGVPRVFQRILGSLRGVTGSFSGSPSEFVRHFRRSQDDSRGVQRVSVGFRRQNCESL